MITLVTLCMNSTCSPLPSQMYGTAVAKKLENNRLIFKQKFFRQVSLIHMSLCLPHSANCHTWVFGISTGTSPAAFLHVTPCSAFLSLLPPHLSLSLSLSPSLPSPLALYNGLQWLHEESHHSVPWPLQHLHSGQLPSGLQAEPWSAMTHTHTRCCSLTS